MSVIDIDKIDSIGIDKITNTVTLAITDHLTWEHENQHLILLEEKINLYLNFIDSEDVYKYYPQSKDKLFEIKIFFTYKPSFKAKEFIRLAKFEFQQNNMDLSYEIILAKNTKAR